MPNDDFFTSCDAHINCAIMAMLYTHSIGVVYVNCAIIAMLYVFVMYCLYGESGSPLLLESIDAMIIIVTVVVLCVCVCVCVSVRSFLPPRASRPRNIHVGKYVFTATRKTFIYLL